MSESHSRRRAIQQLALVGAAPALLPLVRAQAASVPRASRSQQDPMSDDEIRTLLRLASVPSVSTAVIRGDEISLRSVGVRRAGEAAATTPDTVYAAASLTKPMFAYTVLGLVREGLFSLDRPLRDILPLPNPEDPHAAGITARRLLSHTGGWPNWRNTTSTPLVADFEPGSQWSYSGEGFFFLQRVVEHLTKRSIGEIMRERVFAPLGMTRTALLLTEAMEPELAVGHSGRGSPRQPFGRESLLEMRRIASARGTSLDAITVEEAEQAMRAAQPTLPVLPNFMSPNVAASLQTSVSDYARFLRHIVTARQAGGAAAAIVAQMYTPQVRCNEAVQWGLGVGLEAAGGRTYAWQWGDNPGYKHIFFADAERGEATVVFTNGDRGARVYERVGRSLTGMDHPAFLWL